MISWFGLDKKVRGFTAKLARDHLVRWLCESLGRRAWSGEPDHGREIGGIVAVWKDLVTAQDAARFTRNTDELLTVVRADASKWSRRI